MKGTIFLVLMTTAVISCSSLFDAKQDAKDAVNNKYNEAKNLFTKIERDISNEKAKNEENALNQIKSTLNNVVQETQNQLKKNVMDATRTAIAKGKPLQAIDCIENTFLDGNKIISDSKEISNTAIDNVLINKQKKLAFLEAETKLISDGLKELVSQALKKIEEMKGGFELVVTDVSKKVESAKKQLHEIETKVPLPLIGNEYANLRKTIENKYKEISDTLLKRLQKCVA